MNIRTAVHVIVIAVSLLVATLVFLLQSRSRESMAAIDEIHTRHVASALQCSAFVAEVMLVSQWLHDVSATRAAPGFDDGWAESDAAMGRALAIARELEKLLVEPQDRQTLAAAVAALPNYQEVGKRMARQYVEGGPAAGNALMDEFDAAADGVKTHAEDLQTRLRNELETQLEHVELAEASAVSWSNWIAVIALLGCAYTAFQLRRSVLRPLQDTITGIRDIADGRSDLAQTLAVQGPGELRELADAFNRVSGRFRDLVGEVAGHAAGLHSSTIDMTSSAESMAQRASDTHGRAAVVASAAEELSITMSQLTKETTELSQQLDQIVGATARIDTSVQQVSTSTDRTANVAGQAAQLAESGIERISRLTTAADAIGKVVATIQDIAEQTNLLALNATIEAARAGESGKGFAVVATEVKTLANQTATSTDEIRDQVIGIQRSSHDVDDSINSVVTVVQEAYTLSKSAADAVVEQRQELASITRMVQEVASTLRTVMNAIGQSAQASQEIAQTISEVDNDSRDFQSRSSAMLVSIESVQDKSSQLSSLAGQFMSRA